MPASSAPSEKRTYDNSQRLCEAVEDEVELSRAALAVIETPVALVVAGDMPRMVPAVLQRLASTVGADRPAVNLEVPRRMQPLPMAISVEAARPAVAALLERGERSLRALLTELGTSSIPAPVWLSLDPAGITILDVNRPGDLRG